MNLRQSLDRILSERHVVFQTFYSHFLERFPELRHHFAGINLTGQGLMLTVSVQAAVEYHLRRFPAMEAYLRHVGAKHERLNVARDSYPKFRDAMLETLAKFHGNDWSPELAGQWRDALDGATRVMLEGYGTPVGV